MKGTRFKSRDICSCFDLPTEQCASHGASGVKGSAKPSWQIQEILPVHSALCPTVQASSYFAFGCHGHQSRQMWALNSSTPRWDINVMSSCRVCNCRWHICRLTAAAFLLPYSRRLPVLWAIVPLAWPKVTLCVQMPSNIQTLHIRSVHICLILYFVFIFFLLFSTNWANFSRMRDSVSWPAAELYSCSRVDYSFEGFEGHQTQDGQDSKNYSDLWFQTFCWCI